MKWIASIFLALIASPTIAEQFAIVDFKGGLNSNYSSLTIADNEAQDALNVYFDKDNLAVKREGFSVCGSSKQYSYSGAWSYSDSGNSTYLIIRSSDAIIAGNSGCNFTIQIATVTDTDRVNAVNALGNIWFVDRTQGLYYFNGTSTTYVSAGPHGEFITEFRERICISGLSHPNGNDVYCSAYLDGTNWTTSSVLATGAVLFRVGLNDAYDNITGLFSGYNDAMQIWKNRSMYALYGFDKDDFQVRILTREAGTVDQRSIKPYMGGLVFASERGIEFFNGVQVQTPPISDKVFDKLEGAVNSNFSEASWVQTTQSDFESGTIVPSTSLSTTISPGSVTLSSGTTTYTSLGDFSQGVTSMTYIFGDSVRISTNSANWPNNGFEDVFTTNDWTAGTYGERSCANLVGSNCLLTPRTGSCALSDRLAQTPGYTVRAQVYDYDSNLLAQTDYIQAANSCTYQQKTLLLSGQERKSARIVFTIVGVGVIADTQNFLLNGDDITFYIASDNAAGDGIIYIDDVMNGRSTINLGWYRTPSLDTGMTQSVMTISVGSTTVSNISDNLASYTYQTSEDDLTWGGLISNFNNQTVDRYVRLVSTWSRSDIGGAHLTAAIDDVTFNFSRSSGSYYSPVHSSPDLNSFGSLTVGKSDNGGTHTFYMRSSTNTFTILSGTPSWVAQGPNTTIGISSGTYFQVRDDFAATIGTRTPTLNDFAVSWFEGVRKPPMASITDEKRYYLSLATSTTDSENSATLVLSPGPVWSLWDLKAGAFVTHKGQIYHTNNTSNGEVYSDFSGTNDAGTAINSFIKTKDYALGDITKDKLFDSLYIISDSSTGSDLDTSYFVNRSTTSYALHSLDLESVDGMLSEKLNFPINSTSANRGKTISLRFSNDDLDEAMRLYGGILNYRTRMTE